MAVELQVKIYDRADLNKYTAARERETKIGQSIRLLTSTLASAFAQSLSESHEAGVRYAIILIPEDIGARANYGQSGADQAPASFLKYFLNMQVNHFLDCSKVAMIGEVIVDDLMRKSKAKGSADITNLRDLCTQLDDRIAPIIHDIALAGLEPIVIGGTNSNSLPVIQGVCEALRVKESDISLSVVNCDPHADFRPLEGRHSGNPFSYASDRGYLKRYCVFGMQESYNSEETLEHLEQHQFKAIIYEDFAIRQQTSFEESLDDALQYATAEHMPLGLEVDLDSIKNMPSSAGTPLGIFEEQAAYFVNSLASQTNCRYLLLSEGAPALSADDGERRVGKCLSLLVMTYLKAREDFKVLWQ